MSTYTVSVHVLLVVVCLVANAIQLTLPPGTSPLARHHSTVSTSPALTGCYCCCTAAAVTAVTAAAAAHTATTAATAVTVSTSSTAGCCLCTDARLSGLKHLRHPVHFSLSNVQACLDEGVLEVSVHVGTVGGSTPVTASTRSRQSSSSASSVA
jgi:hypothetical protein